MPYKDPEKAREYGRHWRLANPEKVRENKRRWSLANPEKAAENNRRQNDKRRQARRAEKKGIPAMLKVVSQDRNERQLEGNAK